MRTQEEGGGGWKQGASTAGPGGGGAECTASGVPRETFQTGDLTSCQIVAPAFHDITTYEELTKNNQPPKATVVTQTFRRKRKAGWDGRGVKGGAAGREPGSGARAGAPAGDARRHGGAVGRAHPVCPLARRGPLLWSAGQTRPWWGAGGDPAASQVGAFRRGLEQRLGGCTRLVTARKSPLAPSPSSCPTRTTVLLLATGSRGPAATAGARRCPTERLASTPDEGVGYPVGYSQEWTGPLGPPARADPSAGAPCSQPSPREAGQPGDLG